MCLLPFGAIELRAGGSRSVCLASVHKEKKLTEEATAVQVHCHPRGALWVEVGGGGQSCGVEVGLVCEQSPAKRGPV